MIGFPGIFRDGLMSGRWDHALIGFVSTFMERGLFTVYQWDLGLQLLGTVATAVSHVNRDDLSDVDILAHPNPLRIGLLRHNAPPLIGFGCRLPDHHVCWAGWWLDMSGLGIGHKALDRTAQEPREADAHRPADPAEGNALVP
jgi:hypothetical protein